MGLSFFLLSFVRFVPSFRFVRCVSFVACVVFFWSVGFVVPIGFVASVEVFLLGMFRLFGLLGFVFVGSADFR